MATETNTVKISIKTFGNDELKKLNATFGRINKTLVLNKKSLNDTVASILRVDKRAKSFNGGLAKSNKIIQDQIAAFKVLRDQVDKGGAAYSRFTNEINKLNTSLSIQPNANAYAFPIGPQMDTRGRFAKMRDRFLGSAKNMGVGSRAALGAIAGSGVAGNFGAIGSFGLSGAAVGGPVGAAVGVGLGAAAEGLRFGAESARYAADIQKLQIALKGVTKNQKDFTKGLDVIAKTSKRLNVPVAASTRQFTTLAASVLGAGGTIEDAEEVFTGVSNAIKATGGNAEDVQSAIRAMSQIFGKGKVSAEELQGQLGERLAGAVVKFAEANGSSLQKLQKDLRDGTVGLGQIMNFAKKLNVDFAETAEKVADSSADAGQRLQTSMDRLKLAVGTILQPIGAAFQRVFGNIVNAITDAIEAFNRFMGIGLGNALKKTQEGIESIDKQIEAAEARNNNKLVARLKSRRSQLKLDLAELTKDFTDEASGTSNLPDATTPPSEDTINKYLLSLGEITKEEFEARNLRSESEKIIKDMKAANIDLGLSQDEIIAKLKESANETFNLKEKFKDLIDSTTDLKTNIGTLALDVTDKLGDAFADFFTEGKRGFADLARSAIKELQRIIVKAAFMKFIANPILGFLNLNAKGNVIEGGEVVPSAMGNVFAKNKIVPYAMGGIVNKPTFFPMANGAGLMGEAGPEAIMPLKRGANGKLGVQSSGGVGNIVVNVDASGTSVEGDAQQSEEFGRALAAAIQSELISQQRPGGLLA